ncbi:hypothetical protein CANINC_002825 [Pichia inconspicua]|uniref:Uncharacterized protein n=1 Tax=Pichia inconspicua TaxID=52247 RepID=A0A4T0X0J3_9ASCO|nr:hypothetical protein CANINC_002825 [[Candida] inconspicua]
MAKVLHLRNRWSLLLAFSFLVFTFFTLNSLFHSNENQTSSTALNKISNTKITENVNSNTFKPNYAKTDEFKQNLVDTSKNNANIQSKEQIKNFETDMERFKNPTSDKTDLDLKEEINDRLNNDRTDVNYESKSEISGKKIDTTQEVQEKLKKPNEVGIGLSEITVVKEVPKKQQDEIDSKNPNQKVMIDEETAKKVIKDVKEQVINDSDDNLDTSFEQLVDKILENKLQGKQDSILDSSYAKHEITEDSVDEKDKKIIEQEIKQMKQMANVDTNPAMEYKDWSITVDQAVESVTPEEFRKGNSLTRKLFKDIIQMMYGNRLSFPLQQRMKMKDGKTVIEPVVLVSEISDDMSEEVVEGLFDFPINFLEDAKIKHKIVTSNLPNLEPNFYGGNGYVTVGGGKYSWFALLVIEVLRHLGSVYPVEVFIPTDAEYEKVFCEEVLPKYNARCIVISNVFDAELIDKIKVTGYQYKSLALLASSFENAFLLDSDNYPVMNPDHLFESELYQKYNMITWPDYWRRTTSPYYYQITDKKIGKQVRYLDDEDTDPKYYKLKTETRNKLRKVVQFHDREGTLKEWTTESGQMLINKRIHFKPLLLALYYNLEGQFGYYPLLSQGGAGEGDKETFVAASHFYDLEYYQVHKKPDRAYGFHKWRKNLVDTSIVQYDPVRDYEVLQYVNKGIQAEIDLLGDNFEYDYFNLHQHKYSIEVSRPIFYHVHETKMDPFELYKIQATYDLKGRKLRNLGGDFPRFDFDLEMFLWQQVNKHLCIEDTDVFFISDPAKKDDRKLLCAYFLPGQLDFLSSSHSLLVEKYEFRRPYDNLWRCDRLNLSPEEKEKEDELERLKEEKERLLEEQLEEKKKKAEEEKEDNKEEQE